MRFFLLLVFALLFIGSRGHSAHAQATAALAPGAFLLMGTSAAGATGVVALGALTAPIAGLAVVTIAGGYVLYMTHEQHAQLVASGQLSRWQESGLNSDLAVETLSAAQVGQCRIQSSGGVTGGGLDFRRCILGLVQSPAREASLSQTSSVMESIPSVEDRIRARTSMGTAYCRPQHSNEELMRKTEHNDFTNCGRDLAHEMPRGLEGSACATRASADEFLNRLARCQSVIENLNYCLYLLEGRGLLAEYRRRTSGVEMARRREQEIRSMQAIIPHLESRCLQKLNPEPQSAPARPPGAVQ